MAGIIKNSCSANARVISSQGASCNYHGAKHSNQKIWLKRFIPLLRSLYQIASLYFLSMQDTDLVHVTYVLHGMIHPYLSKSIGTLQSKCCIHDWGRMYEQTMVDFSLFLCFLESQRVDSAETLAEGTHDEFYSWDRLWTEMICMLRTMHHIRNARSTIVMRKTLDDISAPTKSP